MTQYPWHGCAVPARRRETHGGRIVTCFAERPKSLHALFARDVTSRPEHEMLVAGDERWTYARAEGEVARIAAGFAALGIGQGDRVAMLIGNRSEFVFVLFALQRLGAIAVPIGVREQRPGLAFILNQCGASAIVFDAGLADRIPDAAEAPSLRSRIAVGAAAGAHTLEELRAAGDGCQAPVADVREQDTAVILYTSGTTGQPKGAMLTHLNIAHSVLHYEAGMRLGPDDRSALAVPASHVTGLIATIASMAHVGGTIVIVPEFKAADFIR